MTHEERLARINTLARKQREEGLTEAERQEQAQLRQAYLAGFRRNLEMQLEHTVLERPDGSRERLKKKES